MTAGAEAAGNVLGTVMHLLDKGDYPLPETAAMAEMGPQEHLARCHGALAERRGVRAVRNGGPASTRYAEAYQRVFPQVSAVRS